MKLYAFVAAAMLTITACGDTETTTTETIEAPPAPVAAYDPDTTDTIPGDAYPAYCSDTAKASLIARSLQEAEKEYLSSVPAEDRFFKYHEFDLNNDNKMEYAVALFKPTFCGSGGCTAYILNADGTVHTRFTVVRYPLYVGTTATDGWQDLMVYSGGENRWAKHKAGKYPSNPSTEPVVKGEIPQTATTLLNIWDGGAYPAFTF